jgi:hypothetical protein
MVQLPLDRFPEVLEQVEAIGDLPRLWRSLVCAVGIKPGAITADNLDLSTAARNSGTMADLTAGASASISGMSPR